MKRDDATLARPAGALEALAERACDAMKATPDDVLHAARRCLVDWLGVALGGTREDAPRRLARALGVPTGFGAPQAPAMIDALLLGTCGHVLDYDDTHAGHLVHASASVVPALVATARRHPLSGSTLLQALAAGYEVEARIGARLGRPLTARGWHVSGVIGPFGAATAASLATGGTRDVVAQALAIAGTGSAGLIAAFGTMTKSLQLGRTAAGGVLAADFARAGANGPLGLFDTPGAFAVPLVGEDAGDFAASFDAFGQPWAILGNSFKPHASCMITHPSIDAAIALRRKLGDAAIASVECRVNVLAPKVAGHARPATGLEGKFSVAYCVAAGLLDGRATPDRFADAEVHRGRVAALLERIRVVPDASIGETAAEVVVTLEDGRRFAERVTTALGHPGNPISDEALGDKFLALAAPVLGEAHAASALRATWQVHDEPDAGRWLARHFETPSR